MFLQKGNNVQKTVYMYMKLKETRKDTIDGREWRPAETDAVPRMLWLAAANLLNG